MKMDMYRNLDGFFLPVTTLNYLQISFSCDTDSSIRYVKTIQSKYIYIILITRNLKGIIKRFCLSKKENN